MTLTFDHFIYGVPRLDSACVSFADKTGITPKLGGGHPKLGTLNALISLGASYFEILTANPEWIFKDVKVKSLATNKLPKLIGWAIQCQDFTEVEKLLEDSGLEMSPVARGQRETPQKQVLKYDFAEIVGLEELGVAVPFFIKWIETEHPSKSAPSGCQFGSFSVMCPAQESFQNFIEATKLPIEFSTATEPSIALQMKSPKGNVIFK